MHRSLTLGAFTATLLITTAALSADTNVKTSAVAKLEPGQTVTISGTVDRLSDEDTFILRDSTGKNVDVHTAGKLTVKQGDKVMVAGKVEDEVAGMGEQIKATSVTTISTNTAAHTEAKGDTKTSSMHVGDVDVDVSTTKTGETTANAGVAGGAVDTPYEMRQEKAPEVASMDVKVDVDTHNNDKAAVATTAAATTSTIESLPKTGQISISGIVDRVRDKDTFILRDSAGKTIDVHTTAQLDVKQGDKVAVEGKMKDEIAGLGREIVDADIMVTAAGAAKTGSGY